jgi:hypothetical protein
MAVKIQVRVFKVMILYSVWRQQGPLKRWYPTATLYHVTTWKTTTLISDHGGSLLL